LEFDIRYKHVEAALADLYLVPEESLKTFRARLRHLRKVGVPILPKVGSGRQIAYSPDQVFQLFLGLEMSNWGTPPTTIAAFIAGNWANLGPMFRQALAAESSSARFLVFSPSFMSEIWSEPAFAISGPWLVTRGELLAHFPADPAGSVHIGSSAVITLTNSLRRLAERIEYAVHTYR
jgi:hypothetical protein